MLHRITVAACMLLLCSQTASLAQIERSPRTRRELITQLRRALEEQNPQAIENLYYWEGVDHDIRTLHREMFRTLVRTYIEEVEFSPLTEDYETEIVEDGQRYAVNLPIRGLITISLYDDILEQRGTISIPYGQHGRIFYLAGLIRDESASEDGTHFYTIIVQSLLFPDPIPFRGIYEYEKQGVRDRTVFRGEGYYKETFQADSLRACIVKKEGETGWVRMNIRKNGQLIWEGKQAESSEPLIYRRASP